MDIIREIRDIIYFLQSINEKLDQILKTQNKEVEK